MLTWIAIAVCGTSTLVSLISYARKGKPFAGLMATLFAGFCAANLWLALN